MINEIADKNRKATKQASDILQVELNQDPYFGNYLLEYGDWTFQLNTKIFDSLHNIYVQGFEEGLKRFRTAHVSNLNILYLDGLLSSQKKVNEKHTMPICKHKTRRKIQL